MYASSQSTIAIEVTWEPIITWFNVQNILPKIWPSCLDETTTLSKQLRQEGNIHPPNIDKEGHEGKQAAAKHSLKEKEKAFAASIKWSQFT